MVKVAMIGAGGYAHVLMNHIWDIPEKYEFIAVCSNPKRHSAGAAECREKGICVYSDPDDLLRNVAGKADVIIVPTPIYTHFSLAKKSLAEGLDVFLEKPPVAAIQELDELISYAKAKNKIVPVMFQHLYSPVVQKLKARISAGEFGRVKKIKGMAGWPRLDNYFTRSSWAGKIRINDKWVLDGTVNNPTAHMLADQLYLASATPAKMADPITIEAQLYHAHDIDSEDTSCLRIITADEVEILFYSSLCTKDEFGPCVEIECEHASIEYIDFNKAIITGTEGNKEEIIDETDHRDYMFKTLADGHPSNSYAISLETCRPFTLCANGAFESSTSIHTIDSKHIKRINSADSIKTIINGIDDHMRLAFKEAKLFSQINLPWSVQTKTFSLEGYNFFPSSDFRA